jgi:hypothetical protein
MYVAYISRGEEDFMYTKMVRKNVYLPSEMWKQSKRVAKFISLEEDRDISASEVIRRSLVEFIFKYDKFKSRRDKQV